MAPAGGGASDPGDAPVEPGVHGTDWLSLLLLTAGAFVAGSAGSVVWKSRTGQPLPGPLTDPLRAGLAASGAVFVLGIIYLAVVAVRSRRR